MTQPASAEELGGIHAQLTAMFKALLEPREEPIIVKGEVLLKEDGTPYMRTIMPTAAEMAAATTFLKNNNITAPAGNSDALKELADLMAKRKANTLRPALADPYEALPEGFGKLN